MNSIRFFRGPLVPLNEGVPPSPPHRQRRLAWIPGRRRGGGVFFRAILAEPFGCRPLAMLLMAAPLAACQGASVDLSGPADAVFFPDGSLLPADAGPRDAGPRFSSPCATDDQCASGVCDSQYNGTCCNHACTSGDAICGATGCDAFGECIYPTPATSCGTHCAAAALTDDRCDGQGHCQAGSSPSPCPTGYGCAVGNTSCAPRCADQSQCASGFYCSAQGTCAPTAATGFCDNDNQCSSGACGISGSGACCAVNCRIADTECAATGCDPTSAACRYPGAEVRCGPSTCSQGELTRGACDAQGDCGPPTRTACPGRFGCAADGINCLTSCVANSDCGPHASCDGPYNVCCPALPDHSTVFAADQVTVFGPDGPIRQPNQDSPCCGFDSAHPCATLGRAMQQIAQSAAVGSTISVSGGTFAAAYQNFALPNSGCEWNSDAETWPVHLGWGVTLYAPGMAFHMGTPQWRAIVAAADPNQGPSGVPMFDVKAYDAGDVFPVTIRGGYGLPCSGQVILGETYQTLGLNPNATLVRPDSAGGCSLGPGNACGQGISQLVLDEGLPLTLDQVFLAYAYWDTTFGVPGSPAAVTGLTALGGSAVALGPGAVTVGEPDVFLGSVLPNDFNLSGPPVGLLLNPDQGPPVSLTDDTGGQNILNTAQIAGFAIEVLGPATVSLTHGPTLGQTPLVGADQVSAPAQCPWLIKQFAAGIPNMSTDGNGISIESDGVAFTFGSKAQPGTIQCMGGGGGVNLLADGVGAAIGTGSYLSSLGTFSGATSTSQLNLVNTTVSASACAGLYAGFGTIAVSGGSTITGNQVGAWQGNDVSGGGAQGTIVLDDPAAPNTVACNTGQPLRQMLAAPPCLGDVVKQGAAINYGANLANLTSSAPMNAKHLILGRSDTNVCDSTTDYQFYGQFAPDGVKPASCQCTGPACATNTDALGIVSVSPNDPNGLGWAGAGNPFQFNGFQSYQGTCP